MMRVRAFSGLLSALIAGSVIAPAAATAAPLQPSVDLVTVNGSGCPIGTAAIELAPDGRSFELVFGQFSAMVGIGAKPTDARKNCQLAIQVSGPSGYTFGLRQASYRGVSELATGATAQVRANYYFQGMSPTTYLYHPFVGPMADVWQTTDLMDIASIQFAPCGEARYLNVNLEARVSAGRSDPALTTSYLQFDSAGDFEFAWHRC